MYICALLFTMREFTRIQFNLVITSLSSMKHGATWADLNLMPQSTLSIGVHFASSRCNRLFCRGIFVQFRGILPQDPMASYDCIIFRIVCLPVIAELHFPSKHGELAFKTFLFMSLLKMVILLMKCRNSNTSFFPKCFNEQKARRTQPLFNSI